MDLNLKQMRWTHKEFDIVPSSEEEEKTGLISGTQTLCEFPGCYGFSLSLVGGTAYVLGNISQAHMAFYRLNLQSLELEDVGKSEELQKLSTDTFIHSAFVCNERIYVLYNICPQNLNCLAIYDPPGGAFYQIKGDTHASTFRINYSVNEYKGMAYVFGGLNESCEPLNTLEIFDVTTYRWRAATAHGKLPAPRHCHAACVLKNTLYVFGGTSEVSFKDPEPLTDMHALDLASSTWSQVQAGGNIPKGNAISMGAIDESNLALVWSDKGEVKVSVFNSEKGEWKELGIEGGKPTRRYGCTGLVSGSKIVILGGFSESEYQNVAYANVLELKRYPAKTGGK